MFKPAHLAALAGAERTSWLIGLRKASRYLRSEKALAVGQFKRKKPSAFRLQAP